jgi:hypothetical protein
VKGNNKNEKKKEKQTTNLQSEKSDDQPESPSIRMRIVLRQISMQQIATHHSHGNLRCKQRQSSQSGERGFSALRSDTHRVVVQPGGPDRLPQRKSHHKQNHRPNGGRERHEEWPESGDIAAVFDHIEVRPVRSEGRHSGSEPDDHERIDRIDDSLGIVDTEASNDCVQIDQKESQETEPPESHRTKD